MSLLAHLPGGDLIAEGLQDCAAGRITPAACLIALGWPRLVRAGLDMRGVTCPAIVEPESQLYQFLREAGGDAYSHYNSLIRQLISFEHSLEQQDAQPLIRLKS